MPEEAVSPQSSRLGTAYRRAYAFLDLAFALDVRVVDADFVVRERAPVIVAETRFAAIRGGNRASSRRQMIRVLGSGTSRKKASRNWDGLVADGISSLSCLDHSPQ